MARTDLKEQAEQVKASSQEKVERIEDQKAQIPSGLTILNLALADNPFYGYRTGSIVNIIGDSHSGKSILALSGLAEAARDPNFEHYRLIYDDAEAANAFDMERLFGKALVGRIEPPGTDAEFPNSETVEEFHHNIAGVLREGDPVIYVLDSLDALTSEDEIKRAEEDMKAREEGKEPKGSYKMEKAKKMSEMFRLIVKDLKRTDSLLVIISQTRENINPMSFKKKTRSGGTALDFYASIIMWLAKMGIVTITKNKKKRAIGSSTKVSIDKNKYTGKKKTIEFETFYDYGVDDLGAIIDWMNDEGFWPGKTKIDPEGLKLEPAQRKTLIENIEKADLERRARILIGKKWREIEDSLKLGRKSRF